MENEKLTKEYINKTYWLAVKTRLDLEEFIDEYKDN